jgi:hypothetical protein
LRTFSADRARSLAAQLDAVLAEIVMQAETTFLSPPQLDAILRRVIAMHSAKLDRVAAAAKAAPFCDVGEEVRMDRRVGWVYRLLDAQGADAFVRPADRTAMIAAGLTEQDVSFVYGHLHFLRVQRMVPPPRGRGLSPAYLAASGGGFSARSESLCDWPLDISSNSASAR